MLPAWAARRLDLSLIGGNLSLFKGLKMFRESGGGVQGSPEPQGSGTSSKAGGAQSLEFCLSGA